MKIKAYFPLKDKRKKLTCRLLQFLFCALRVKNAMVNVLLSRIIKTTLDIRTEFLSKSCGQYPQVAPLSIQEPR